MSEIPGIDLVSEVKLHQSSKSKGFRTRAGFLMIAAAGVKTKLDVSFPYDIDLTEGDYFEPSGANLENRLWVEVAPNTPLHALVPSAAITNNVVAGDTEVVLNAQATAALSAFLTSGGVTQNDEVWFRLTSVPGDPTDFTALKKAKWNSATSKLTSYSGAFGLTATAGDSVFVTVRFEDGTYIARSAHVRIGDDIIGSSYVPANTTLRFVVENADGAAQVKIGFNLSYLHS